MKKLILALTTLFFTPLIAKAGTQVYLDFIVPKASAALEQSMFTRVLTYHNRQLVNDEQLNGNEAHSKSLHFDNVGDCRILVVYSLPLPAKKGEEIIEQKITYLGEMASGYSSQSFQVHPAYILADKNFKEIPEYWYHVIMRFFPIVPIGKVSVPLVTQVGNQAATAQLDGIECVGTIENAANGEYVAAQVLRGLP